jgi:hypothetical protein
MSSEAGTERRCQPGFTAVAACSKPAADTGGEAADVPAAGVHAGQHAMRNGVEAVRSGLGRRAS